MAGGSRRAGTDARHLTRSFRQSCEVPTEERQDARPRVGRRLLVVAEAGGGGRHLQHAAGYRKNGKWRRETNGQLRE